MSYLEAAIPSLTLVIFPRAGMGVTHGGLLFRSTIKYHEDDGMYKFVKNCARARMNAPNIGCYMMIICTKFIESK